MATKGKIKVLMGKVGLDGHDIDMKVISALLREAGVEVIYLGAYQTPASIVAAAVQEGVDFIGISFLGGDHLEHSEKVIAMLKKDGLNIPVIVGGVIPRQDIPVLKKAGVAEVFEAGSSIDDIINYVKDNAPARSV